MRRSLIDNLEPKALFTWPVFLFTLALALLTHLLDSAFTAPGDYGLRILTLLIAHTVLFTCLKFGIALIESRSPLLRASLMIPLIVLASVLRGLAVWSILLSFGLGAPNEFTYRVFTSITNNGLALFISGIAMHRVMEYQTTRSKLLSENRRILMLQKLHQTEIRTNTEEQLEQIREQISFSIFGDKTRSPGETSEAISKTLVDVLEPLIKSTQTITHLPPETESGSKSQIDWLKALSGALEPRFLNPPLAALALTFAPVTFVFLTLAPQEAIPLLIAICSGSFFLLHFLRLGATQLSNHLPQGVIAPLLLLATVVCGFLMAGMTNLFTAGTPAQSSFLNIAPLAFTVVTLLLSFAGSVQYRAEAANERLGKTSSQLAWETSRVLNEDRLQKKAISRLLHGKIQVGLFANLMKLKGAAASDAEVIDRVEKEVRQDLTELVSSAKLTGVTEIQTLNQMFMPVIQLWEEAAEISLADVPPPIANDVERDPVLMGTLVELITELTFNSIKHGAAKQIRFYVNKVSDNTIQLMCTDNGSLPADSGRIGLGTTLLDECALEWTREPNHDLQGTKTTVLLPFSPAH